MAVDERAPGDGALVRHFVEQLLGLPEAAGAAVETEEDRVGEDVGREAELGGRRMALFRGGWARQLGGEELDEGVRGSRVP